jgi:hypothetical protein
MSLLSLLVALIIVCLIFWACRAILAAFGIGDPIATIIYVFLVILVVFWLIGALGGGSFGTLGSIRLR